MSQEQDPKRELARTLNKQKISSSKMPLACKHVNNSIQDNNTFNIKHSTSTTQHLMTTSDWIDTHMVDCVSFSASLERRSCALVSKSYIQPLARSPLAAGINWATACIAPQKKPAKLQHASKEDKTDGKDAIEELAHGSEDSRLLVRPKTDEIGKPIDGVMKALAELQAAVQEQTKVLEEIARASETEATLIKALKARGILI